MREKYEDYMVRRLREEEEARNRKHEAEYEERKWKEFEEYANMMSNQAKNKIQNSRSHHDIIEPKIFESPDGGKTVYERAMGAPSNTRRLVQSPEEQKINEHRNIPSGWREITPEDGVDYKFNEDKLIEEFKRYVDSTYKAHYSQNKFQSTEVIIERGHGTGFCMGSIDKYSNRYGKKGSRADARKDLMKILHYALLQLYIHDNENS